MPVTYVACGDADHTGRDVVAHVADEGELRRSVFAAARTEELGRSEDQQRRRGVPDLERADACHELAERPNEYGADAEADGLSGLVAGDCRVPNRVDDCEGGEQARDHGQADRPACPDRADEDDREQRPEDRSQVVHCSLEAVGASIRVPAGRCPRATRCAVGTRRPRGLSMRRRWKIATCAVMVHARDARGQHGSCCVAAHGDRSPAVGIVG